jgi:hypothetical protein
MGLSMSVGQGNKKYKLHFGGENSWKTAKQKTKKETRQYYYIGSYENGISRKAVDETVLELCPWSSCSRNSSTCVCSGLLSCVMLCRQRWPRDSFRYAVRTRIMRTEFRTEQDR